MAQVAFNEVCFTLIITIRSDLKLVIIGANNRE